MNSAITRTNNGNGAIAQLEEHWNREQIELLKTQIAKDCTDIELLLFKQVCQSTGLNPFLRQIYAVKRKGKMTIQTGIDGFWAIAEESGDCAGCDEPLFDEGVTIDQVEMENRKLPRSAKVTVYRVAGGLRCGFTAVATWREYAPENLNEGAAFMWKKMPFHMLAKCAESKALRKAFPKRLSGLYTTEEMAQASAGTTQVTLVGTPVISPNQQKRLFAISREAGWNTEAVKELLATYGYQSSRDIKLEDYDAICAALQARPDIRLEETYPEESTEEILAEAYAVDYDG